MDAVHVHEPALSLSFEAIDTVFGALGVPTAALIAGLAVGATHCPAMCGPFVLPQVLSRPQADPTTGRLARLFRATLPLYHLGRLTTYTGLGVAAGGLSGFVIDTTEFHLVLSLFLLVAAASLALKLWTVVAGSVYPSGIARPAATAAFTSWIHWIAGHTARMGPFGLGLALGFLPCGFVYAAVAAAAGTGSALIGGITVAAFGLGTMPGLMAVAYFGSLLTRRWQRAAQLATIPLLALNVVVLTLMAVRNLA